MKQKVGKLVPDMDILKEAGGGAALSIRRRPAGERRPAERALAAYRPPRRLSDGVSLSLAPRVAVVVDGSQEAWPLSGSAHGPRHTRFPPAPPSLAQSRRLWSVRVGGPRKPPRMRG